MKEKIRLMQITHDLAIGGLQQVVVNLCRKIDKERFDVSVLCLRGLGEYASEIEKLGINVISLETNYSHTDYLSFLKIAKILKNENIDVIHTHNTQPFVEGTIAAILSGVKTIIHTDHARSFPDKRRYMFAEWLMSHFAYKIVGVSDHTADNLVYYEKISRKKIVVIPNGIDGSKYDIKVDKEKKLKEMGVSGSGPVIGLCVRLTEQKGIHYLLVAMQSVIRRIPSITLLIVGKGNLEAKLKQEAKDLGLDNNVIFVGARLDIPEIIKSFDIYVLPSLWEGLPMVLIEAMSAGCPVIATDVGGNKMAIKNGVNGILVEAANTDQLAKAIIDLTMDNESKKLFAKNGKRIFDENFTAQKMVESYEVLYERR